MSLRLLIWADNLVSLSSANRACSKEQQQSHTQKRHHDSCVQCPASQYILPIKISASRHAQYCVSNHHTSYLIAPNTTLQPLPQETVHGDCDNCNRLCPQLLKTIFLDYKKLNSDLIQNSPLASEATLDLQLLQSISHLGSALGLAEDTPHLSHSRVPLSSLCLQPGLLSCCTPLLFSLHST